MKIEKMKISEVSDKTLVNYLKGKGYTVEQSDKDLPKTRGEAGKVSGCFVDTKSNLIPAFGEIATPQNKNIFRTEEQAKASIALAQLSQLMFVYNDGWEPNWEDVTEDQYCIEFRRNRPCKSKLLTTQRFLAFKTEEIRIKFLENFENLIWQARLLL